MDKGFRQISNHFTRSSFITYSALAVIAGGLIYILFRPSEPVFFNWFNTLGFEGWFSAIRDKSLFIGYFLPDWIVYSLPNGLWAFGYTSIVLCIWTGSNSVLKYFWFLTIPVLVFGFELLQLRGNLHGTFCLNDIIWSAIGIAIGCLYCLFNRPSKNFIKT
jgi:hypothetical protein